MNATKLKRQAKKWIRSTFPGRSKMRTVNIGWMLVAYMRGYNDSTREVIQKIDALLTKGKG